MLGVQDHQIFISIYLAHVSCRSQIFVFFVCLIIDFPEDLEKAKDDSSRFFGAEWKNTSRNWSNYLSDLEIEYKNCNNVEEVRTLHDLMCKAGAARKILAAISLHGMGSPKVVDIFDSQMNWLSQQDPPVSTPFPSCLQQRVFTTRASSAWPADVFWQSIRTSEISKLDLPEDGKEGMQVNLFSANILDLSQHDKHTTAKSNLTSLAQSFFASCEDLFSSCAKLNAEVVLLKMAMQATRDNFVLGDGGCTEDKLESFLRDPSEVRQALESLPCGRGIIAAVKTSLERGKAKADSVAHWRSVSTALGSFADCGFLARFEEFSKSVDEGLIASEVLKEIVTLPFLKKFTIEIFAHVQELAHSGTSFEIKHVSCFSACL